MFSPLPQPINATLTRFSYNLGSIVASVNDTTSFIFPEKLHHDGDDVEIPRTVPAISDSTDLGFDDQVQGHRDATGGCAYG